MQSHNGPPQPRNSAKEAALEVLRARDSVHGSGLESLTDENRADIESLLSSAGLTLDDPLMDQLPGETLRDLLDYRSERNSEVRTHLASRIRESINATRDGYYRETT